MSNYITLKNAKDLRKAYNDVFRDIFNIKNRNELTQKENKACANYFIDDYLVPPSIKTYNKMSKSQQGLLKSAYRKLNGDELNTKNTKEALKLLRTAYANHMKYDKPKWYQIFKLYAYWKAEDALEELEDLLHEKGIDMKEINATRDSVMNNKNKPITKLDENEISISENRTSYILLEENDSQIYEKFDLNYQTSEACELLHNNTCISSKQ